MGAASPRLPPCIMTTNEINIAIAQACGWEIHEDADWRKSYVTSPKGRQFSPADPRVALSHFIPNYSESLDAMHSAEATLTDGEFNIYLDCLVSAVSPKAWSGLFAMVTATALQRAEAFLCVKGLWVE